MSFSQTVELELIKACLAGGFAAAVFVFGQIVIRFFLDPIVEMRKLSGQIGRDLVFYRHFFSAPKQVPIEKWEEARSVFRAHASSLRTIPLSIPLYSVVARTGILPAQSAADTASVALIGLSNMSRDADRDEFTWKNDQFDKIHELLDIPDLDHHGRDKRIRRSSSKEKAQP